MRREMEDMRVGQDPEEASSGEQDPEEEQTVVPLEIAAGPKLDDVARDAMRRFGLERVTNQFARCVADCVAKASGGDVAEIDVNAPWVTATNTSERANEHTAPAEGTAPDAATATSPPPFFAKNAQNAATRLRATRDSDLPPSTLAMLRPSSLDRNLEALREYHGETGGPPTVSLAGAELRATHFPGRGAPGGGGVFVRGRAARAGPLAQRHARRGGAAAGRRAGRRRGAALRELRLAGNDALTAVTDAMLKGLAMMRPDVKVVK